MERIQQNILDYEDFEICNGSGTFLIISGEEAGILQWCTQKSGKEMARCRCGFSWQPATLGRRGKARRHLPLQGSVVSQHLRRLSPSPSFFFCPKAKDADTSRSWAANGNDLSSLVGVVADFMQSTWSVWRRCFLLTPIHKLPISQLPAEGWGGGQTGRGGAVSHQVGSMFKAMERLDLNNC